MYCGWALAFMMFAPLDYVRVLKLAGVQSFKKMVHFSSNG